ncbi:hypothetical protein ACFL50_04965 [Candidatus Latescibacterota bacterium]
MGRKYIIIFLLILTGCGGGISMYESLDYDGIIKSGWEKYNQNLFEDAQSLFKQAKDIDSERPEGYIGCGWSLFMRQHPDSALIEFYHGLDYITTLEDSVDTICGISGSYLARNENSRVITLLNSLDLETFEDSFPLKNHDFFLERGDLEIVLAQAYFRLGIYSSTESSDPNNALYHLNLVLFTPHIYSTPDKLMNEMTDYIAQSEGGFYR